MATRRRSRSPSASTLRSAASPSRLAAASSSRSASAASAAASSLRSARTSSLRAATSTPRSRAPRPQPSVAASSTRSHARLPIKRAPGPLSSMALGISAIVAMWAAFELLASKPSAAVQHRPVAPPWPLPSHPTLRAPPIHRDDDDDEILCDCAWTKWPGQSCDETLGRPGFPCWRSCCSQE